MRIALIVIFVIAAGVLITVIAASEAISVAAAFMENDACCGNCKYHVRGGNGDGMCVNADSDACADWTDDSDIFVHGQKGEPMDDLISRQAAIEAIEGLPTW